MIVVEPAESDIIIGGESAEAIRTLKVSVPSKSESSEMVVATMHAVISTVSELNVTVSREGGLMAKSPTAVKKIIKCI